MTALTIHDRHFGGVVTRRSASAWVPDLVAAAGPRATDAYIEFFTATIRNRNTRLAYARACYQFFHWARENGLTLDTVRPFHVAAYIEQIPGSKPTIKQKLAAIRMLYDFRRKSTRKTKPSALFEDAAEQQVTRKPAGKNPFDDRDEPDKLGNWFLHHEKDEKQEPQDPPRTPT